MAEMYGELAANDVEYKAGWKRLAGKVCFALFLVAKALVFCARYALFYVLAWASGLVHLVLGAMSILGLLGVVLGAFLHPDVGMELKMAGFSFACWFAVWLYDGFLMLLLPRSRT